MTKIGRMGTSPWSRPTARFFASVAAVLSSFGFNILKAEAFSNAHGTVIDTFTFADPARNLELNPGETSLVARPYPRYPRRRNGRRTPAAPPRVKPDPHALAARGDFR